MKAQSPLFEQRFATYSHLFNKRGGWNIRGGGAKVAKSLNVEVGINVEGGIFWEGAYTMHTISMFEKIQSWVNYKDPIIVHNRPQKILLNIVSIERKTIVFEKIQ